MINVEVWVPPDIDPSSVLSVSYVKECGNIAAPGRLGWFVPLELMQPVKDYKKVTEDLTDIHWTMFTDLKFTQLFDMSDVEVKSAIRKGAFNRKTNS